jgi:hypothetical protein
LPEKVPTTSDFTEMILAILCVLMSSYTDLRMFQNMCVEVAIGKRKEEYRNTEK